MSQNTSVSRVNPFKTMSPLALVHRHPLLTIMPIDGIPAPSIRAEAQERLVKGRGKVPATHGNGGWVGTAGWQQQTEFSETALANAAQLCSVNMGLVLGQHPALPPQRRLIAIDADITHKDLKAPVEAKIRAMCGGEKAFWRYGNPEKCGTALVVVELESSEQRLDKQRLDFCFSDGTKQAVEILAEGQQSVIAGMHPKGVPYRWSDPTYSLPKCGVNALPVITLGQLRDLMADLSSMVERVGGQVQQRGRDALSLVAAQAEFPVLTAAQAGVLHDALGLAENRLPGHEWVNFSKAYYLICKVPLGEKQARTDLQLFDERWEDGRCEPDRLEGILNENAPPKYYGLRQLVRRLSESMPDEIKGDWTARLHNLEAQINFGSFACGAAPRPIDPWIADMNRIYALLGGEGCTAARNILVFNKDGSWTLEENAKLQKVFANDCVRVGKKLMNRFRAWTLHPQRRTYPGGIRFMPGKPPEADGIFNRWTGWAVTSKAGEWPHIRRHIFEVLCGGDEKVFDYVMDWLAKRVQKPTGPMGTALVFRSDAEGTGKGTFAKWLRKIFGQYCLTVTKSDQAIGRFNANLHDKSLLICEEAFFAGDRSQSGPLKALITDPTMIIEEKFMPAQEVKNHLGVIMFTNEKWIVQAGLTDRRFAIYDVIPQPKTYYSDLYELSEDEVPVPEEIPAFFNALLSRDISNFNVGAFPRTEAHDRQVIYSLRGIDRFTYELLLRGDLPFRELVDLGHSESADFSKWEARAVTVAKSTVRDCVIAFADKRERGRQVLPREIKSAIESIGGTEVRPRKDKNGRIWAWWLPKLSEARKCFSEHYKLRIDWDAAPEDNSDTPEASGLAGSAKK